VISFLVSFCAAAALNDEAMKFQAEVPRVAESESRELESET
jgi:hypothetical protein